MPLSAAATDLRNSLVAHLAKCGTPNWDTTTASEGFITYTVTGGAGTVRFDEDGHYYICTAKKVTGRTTTKEFRSARAAVNHVMTRCSSL